ncbi:hypothetical protein RINTHM_2380 [Richelia intracellularis HM01]|nr:hypothetical protein RINTHM_2380 [Richelia intracellularis HM01]
MIQSINEVFGRIEEFIINFQKNKNLIAIVKIKNVIASDQPPYFQAR